MKKFFALMLAAVMALSLVACGSSNDAKDDQSGDKPAEITSALGILETAWNDYGDDEKFSVVGGKTGENMVEDAPADYDLSDRATAEANLALPGGGAGGSGGYAVPRPQRQHLHRRCLSRHRRRPRSWPLPCGTASSSITGCAASPKR